MCIPWIFNSMVLLNRGFHENDTPQTKVLSQFPVCFVLFLVLYMLHLRNVDFKINCSLFLIMLIKLVVIYFSLFTSKTNSVVFDTYKMVTDRNSSEIPVSK